jgi:hypothetical protein
LLKEGGRGELTLSLISIPDLESARSKAESKLAEAGLEVPSSTFIFQVQRLTSKIKPEAFGEKAFQEALDRWIQCFSSGKVSDVEVTRRQENVVLLIAGGISESRENNIPKILEMLGKQISSLQKIQAEGNAIQRAHKGAAIKYMQAVSIILEVLKS